MNIAMLLGSLPNNFCSQVLDVHTGLKSKLFLGIGHFECNISKDQRSLHIDLHFLQYKINKDCNRVDIESSNNVFQCSRYKHIYQYKFDKARDIEDNV